MTHEPLPPWPRALADLAEVLVAAARDPRRTLDRGTTSTFRRALASGSPGARLALLAAANHEHEQLRRIAVDLLPQAFGDEVVPLLTKLAEDRGTSTPLAAVRSLHGLESAAGAEGLRAVQDAAGTSTPARRSAAAFAAEERQERDAGEIPWIGFDDPVVDRLHTTAIEKIQEHLLPRAEHAPETDEVEDAEGVDEPTTSLSQWVAALEDVDRHEAALLAAALAGSRDEPAQAVGMQHLTNVDAAPEVGSRFNVQVVALLRDRLRAAGRSPQIQEEAARTLGAMESRESVAALIAIVRDPRESMPLRRTAMQALAQGVDQLSHDAIVNLVDIDEVRTHPDLMIDGMRGLHGTRAGNELAPLLAKTVKDPKHKAVLTAIAGSYVKDPMAARTTLVGFIDDVVHGTADDAQATTKAHALIDALGRSEHATATPVLRELLGSATSRGNASACVDHGITAALLAAAQQRADPRLRSGVLAAMNLPKARRSDRRLGVEIAALRALAEVGKAEDLHIPLPSLRSTNAVARREAIAAATAIAQRNSIDLEETSPDQEPTRSLLKAVAAGAADANPAVQRRAIALAVAARLPLEGQLLQRLTARARENLEAHVARATSGELSPGDEDGDELAPAMQLVASFDEDGQTLLHAVATTPSTQTRVGVQQAAVAALEGRQDGAELLQQVIDSEKAVPSTRLHAAGPYNAQRVRGARRVVRRGDAAEQSAASEGQHEGTDATASRQATEGATGARTPAAKRPTARNSLFRLNP